MTRPVAYGPTGHGPVSIAVLVAMLRRQGVTLEVRPGDAGARSDEQLIARPRAQVTAAIADAIRAYKPMLIRAYRSQPPMIPIACQLCRGEFVSTDGQRCRWCEVLRGREVVYEPNSPAERAFLAALERAAADCAQDEPVSATTLPTVPRGTVGQLGEFFGPRNTENPAEKVGQLGISAQLSHELSHARNE